MKENDKRINAYKKAAGFKPEKVSSEEVARNNAAIAALLQTQTDDAISQLQLGRKPAVEQRAAAAFKPFSFSNAPAYRSNNIDESNDTKEDASKKRPSLESIASKKEKSTLSSTNNDSALQSDKTNLQSVNFNKSTNPIDKKPAAYSSKGGIGALATAELYDSTKSANDAKKTNSVPRTSDDIIASTAFSPLFSEPVLPKPSAKKTSTPASAQKNAAQNLQTKKAQVQQQQSQQTQKPLRQEPFVPAPVAAKTAPKGYVTAVGYVPSGKFPPSAIPAEQERPMPEGFVREIVPPKQEIESQFDFAAFAARNGGSAFKPKKFDVRPLEQLASATDLPKQQLPFKEGRAQNFQSASSANATSQNFAKPSFNMPLNANQRDVLFKIPVKTGKESVFRRVAKFLLLIGTDEAAKIIAHLPQDQVDKIIPEIASIRTVPEDEAVVILAEFEELFMQVREGGGVYTARTILEKAFGTEKAVEMIEKSVPYGGAEPFDYLQNLSGEQLSLLLKDESTPVCALVLAQVKPAVAANVINAMSAKERNETVLRLSRLTSFAPDVLQRVDKSLREKVQNMSLPVHDHIDGRGALADILRKMEPGAEQSILQNLARSDSELEDDLRSRLFTLDDIINGNDLFIQKHLNDMSNKDIVLLIHGKKDAFRKKILSNVSKTRASGIVEEEDMLKPFAKKDLERVTSQFVDELRLAFEDGTFIVKGRGEEEWVK